MKLRTEVKDWRAGCVWFGHSSAICQGMYGLCACATKEVGLEKIDELLRGP